MKRDASRVAFLVIALAAFGCSRSADSGQASEAAGSAETEHAPANVQPGSHEDWCSEHGVPESQCTRCNPTLIPAFKATNDWCEEHGLPESQCTKCNPDLRIVRPPPTKGT